MCAGECGSVLGEGGLDKGIHFLHGVEAGDGHLISHSARQGRRHPGEEPGVGAAVLLQLGQGELVVALIPASGVDAVAFGPLEGVAQLIEGHHIRPNLIDVHTLAIIQHVRGEAAGGTHVDLQSHNVSHVAQSLFGLGQPEKFQMEKMDMKRLIEQTLADMDDAIAQSNLSFRTALGDEPLPFLGDNGKMYRVIQNLVENILKYSLGGTRVYIDAGKEKGEIFVTMKNISAYEMNFEVEEMMERFVRGDESRTSEGHGLGLAIASSYTANMGGRMELAADGDLFKVILRFPEAGEDSAAGETATKT